MTPRWLLIHGVPTAGRYWERLRLPGIAAAPDLLHSAASMEDHLAMLRPLAGPDVTIVGVDFGGVLAAMLAAERRAARLVLMSTALGSAWLPSRWTSYSPLAKPFYRWSAGQRFLRAADASGGLAAAFPPGPALAEGMIATARLLDCVDMRAARAGIQQHGVPTLCLWGDSDRFFPPCLGRRLARQLNAEWATVPGRHAVAWTHADAVSAVLSGWSERRRPLQGWALR